MYILPARQHCHKLELCRSHTPCAGSVHTLLFLLYVHHYFAQWYQYIVLLGVTNGRGQHKRRICSARGVRWALRSRRKTTFDCLIILTGHRDAWIFRSGDFRVDNRRQTTNKPITLPLAHACEVIKHTYHVGEGGVKNRGHVYVSVDPIPWSVMSLITSKAIGLSVVCQHKNHQIPRFRHHGGQ